MNKFSFNLQSAFLFVGGTRDVIFKMKTRWHEGYEERKKNAYVAWSGMQ